jgi:hypothetical protein
MSLAGDSEAVSIRCGSIGLFSTLVSWIIAFHWNTRRTLRLYEDSPLVLDIRVGIAIIAITVLVAIAQLAVGFGLAGSVGPGFFFFGLVAFLGYVALGFVRLIVVRPSDDQ